MGFEQGVKKQSSGDSQQCGEMSRSDKGDGSDRLFFSCGNEHWLGDRRRIAKAKSLRLGYKVSDNF